MTMGEVVDVLEVVGIVDNVALVLPNPVVERIAVLVEPKLTRVAGLIVYTPFPTSWFVVSEAVK